VAAAVARGGDAALGNFDYSRAAGRRNLRSAIAGIVISDDDFYRSRPAGLVRYRHVDRIQQSRQILLFVVSGNDYGEFHFHRLRSNAVNLECGDLSPLFFVSLQILIDLGNSPPEIA
jgi:hypothetical protein